MKITLEWLVEQGACEEVKEWFKNQKETDLRKVIKVLIKERRFDWANWTLVRILSRIQRVQYACFSAKQSLHLFEKKYPRDRRPRKAIEAAMAYISNPTESESTAKSAAWSSAAAWSAAAESVAAWSSAAAAKSAAWSSAESVAAWSAAAAAESVAAWSSAAAAKSAAWSSAESVAAWSAAAESVAWKKILNYGVKLCK